MNLKVCTKFEQDDQYLNYVQVLLCYSLYGLKYWKQCLKEISLLPDNVNFVYYGALDRDDLHNIISNYDFTEKLSSLAYLNQQGNLSKQAIKFSLRHLDFETTASPFVESKV